LCPRAPVAPPQLLLLLLLLLLVVVVVVVLGSMESYWNCSSVCVNQNPSHLRPVQLSLLPLVCHWAQRPKCFDTVLTKAIQVLWMF
jgi:hypothetical protein